MCEQPIPSAAAYCTACGFPTALALDALRALSEGDPAPVANAAPRAMPPPRRKAPRPSVPSAEEQLVQRIAQETDANLGILQELGGETLDVASDLRQAALAEADGRVVEALDILRRALGRVQEQSHALFERRVRDVESRDTALRAAGIGSSVTAEAAQMRDLFREGRRLDAIAVLRTADQYLGRIEGDWKGLQGLLKQIEGLRESVRETGGPIPEVEADIQEVRGLLAAPNITIDRLDTASQTAARAVMVLHEALPKALEAELARHDGTLADLPPDHEPVRKAKGLHQDAVRHLRRGRLNEATASIKELRGVLLEMEKFPPPVAVPDEPPVVTEPAPEAVPGPAVPQINTAEFLQRLLRKARDLAARVRTLPADSEIAFEAAGEIRLATELLRSRKLEEAEATLSRLMRTLDAERPTEAEA
ncbi:MAG: hypothetical protein L3J73_05300, partial [Thermoplasmata archaeon]|nr:hypothetical protein [Thermoplasmata archaeon]